MTLRLPPCDMVSTMTLRFGSSMRTRKMFSPPITSRRFSTTSRSAAMKACRRAASRVTRVGAVKRANSAMASFSLWSRIASGALKTRAPSRTAAERSHVATTYSRSNGGSLRISTAAKLFSGRRSDSCLRYQSSSLSVSEMRVAAALTSPLCRRRFSTSQTQTAWPRACAARIIVTVVSLYALSDSGGSMTKSSSRARLFALRDHEVDRGADLGVGKRRVAAFWRHRALALEHRLHERGQAGLDARRPCRLVAELRRAGDARGVARGADLVVYGLAVGRTGLLSRGAGFRLRRRRVAGADLDAADRRDARRDRLGRVLAGIDVHPRGDELHEQDDRDNRDYEREKNHDHELLWRLDERAVLVVRVHGYLFAFCG